MTPASKESAPKETAGVQSIEVGVALLRVLAAGHGAMKLSDLAAAAGMSPSRAHKYLASFIRSGLVRQNEASGRYGIGPLAAELGFAALRTMDVVELAQETLDELRDRLQTVISLTVWANRGPTIVRRALHEQSVSLVVQLGAVMPMLASANGHVFCAYLDRHVTAPLIAAELADKHGPAAKAGLRSRRDVDALIAEIRARGYAATNRTMYSGIAAASAPILDYTGKSVAALTLVGVDGVLDLAPRGEPVRCLREAAAALSARVGGSAAAPALPAQPVPSTPARGSRRARALAAAS